MNGTKTSTIITLEKTNFTQCDEENTYNEQEYKKTEKIGTWQKEDIIAETQNFSFQMLST